MQEDVLPSEGKGVRGGQRLKRKGERRRLIKEKSGDKAWRLKHQRMWGGVNRSWLKKGVVEGAMSITTLRGKDNLRREKKKKFSKVNEIDRGKKN